MIDRQHGRIVVECDACSDTFEGEKGAEWSVVWGAATREGWKSKKMGNEWVHVCGKARCSL